MGEINAATNCTSCPFLSRIESLEKDIERNASQHKEFYRKFGEMDTQMAVQSERYTNLLTLLTKVDSTVTELKEKPAKKWDTVSLLVITSIVSAVVGGFIGKLM